MEDRPRDVAEDLGKIMVEFEQKYPELDAAMKLVGMTISDYERALYATFIDTTITTNSTQLTGDYGDLG